MANRPKTERNQKKWDGTEWIKEGIMDKVTLNIHPEREITLYFRPKDWLERATIIERGADSMFNALIFHYGKYVVDCEFPWVSKDGLTSGIEHKDGWQITIPADEVHKK